MLAGNLGVLAGGGAKTRRPRGFGEFGLELSVNLGETERSHKGDDFLVYPLDGYGATLGWSLLRLERVLGEEETGTPGDDVARLGPLYAEVHTHQMPFGGGGGWAWDPDIGDHGPQAFAYLSTLYVRGRYLVDRGAELSVGMQLKWPLVWIWSR